MKSLKTSLLAVLALAAFGGAALKGQAPTTSLTADALKAFEFRTVGPTLNNGRVVDV